MYSCPSASMTFAPAASRMKRGIPPTDRKARTGLLTPPGMSFCASVNRLFMSMLKILHADFFEFLDAPEDLEVGDPCGGGDLVEQILIGCPSGSGPW